MLLARIASGLKPKRDFPVARPNGVRPRTPLNRGRRIAVLADNDNGGTVAVRFGIPGAPPLVGSCGGVIWFVGQPSTARAATPA
jgi:hypothetical protein